MKTKYLSILPIIAVFAFAGISLAHADVFTQNLYYGLQNNSQVTQLQEFLTAQGFYSGPITGNFYFLTLDAVKAFQTQQGITPAAGYFGPITAAAANKIADAAVGASNAEAVSETGTSTPPTQPSSTVQLQLQALLQQVALLQQQLQTQQSSTQVIQNLQTQVQQQSQTLQQIQQNTQAIQQNTTPATSNNPAPQPPAPTAPTQMPTTTAPTSSSHPSGYSINIFLWPGPIPAAQVTQVFVTNPNLTSWDQDAVGDSHVNVWATLRDPNGKPISNAVMTVVADDPSQNATINGTPNFSGNPAIPYYTYHYVFKTSGSHIITFSAMGATASITFTSVAPTTSNSPSITVGSDINSGSTSVAAGTTGNPLAYFRFSETSGVENVAVKSLVVTDLTSSTQPTFSNVSLWSGEAELGAAGPATPLSSGNGFTYTFTNSYSALIIPADGTVDLTVKGDVASSVTASSTHMFEIASTSDVTLSTYTNSPAPITLSSRNIGGTVTVAGQ